MATVQETEERVARGIDLLEKLGVLHQIDPSILDLSHCKRCALGQIYGDYIEGRNMLASAASIYMETTNWNWSVEHGFTIGAPCIYDEWNILTNEWIRQLKERQAVVEKKTVCVSTKSTRKIFSISHNITREKQTCSITS